MQKVNSNTLWVFIDDSKSNDKKYFITMFIVTEYSNFDNEIRIMKSKLKKIKRNAELNIFLNMPKFSNYCNLSSGEKKIVNNTLTIASTKIIEKSFFMRKIDKETNLDFYYKDHIKQITQYILEKYKHKYKQIIFDHSSTTRFDDLIIYENPGINIKAGDDERDKGLIVVDLLRSKISF